MTLPVMFSAQSRTQQMRYAEAGANAAGDGNGGSVRFMIVLLRFLWWRCYVGE